MNERAHIVYGVTGQVLRFAPPDWREGMPSSSVTYAVYEPGQDLDGSTEFSGTATAPTVSTTFDDASGFSESDRSICNITATTSTEVGRYYFTQNAKNQPYIFRYNAQTPPQRKADQFQPATSSFGRWSKRLNFPR